MHDILKYKDRKLFGFSWILRTGHNGTRHSFDRRIRMYFKWKTHWQWVNGIKKIGK